MSPKLLEKLLDIKHQGLMNEKQILDQIAKLGQVGLVFKPRKLVVPLDDAPEFKSTEWLEKNS